MTITCPGGYSCFYTVDGSTPSTASPQVPGSLTFSSTTTLRVISVQGAVVAQNTEQSSSGWKCVTNVAHTYGSLTCQAGGGVGSITPSNVVWNFGSGGSAMTEATSTTSSTGTTQMLYVQNTPTTACTDCTMLAEDKIVQVDQGSTYALNQEMDANVNMLATYNQFHTASLQCNQQAGNPSGNGHAGGPQWQIDNQQGSWVNTGITYGCPLSTTQQTEVRYTMHWTNGDTSCTGGFSCDSYDSLTVCVGGTNGVGGTCQDFNLGPIILPGYTEPTWSQSMNIQDQPDLTNTTTSGANPTTVTRSVLHNNVTLSHYGTTQIASATYTINPTPAARKTTFSGAARPLGQAKF